MCDSWIVFRLSCESHDGLPNDSSTMLSTVLLATSNRLRVSVFRILPVGDSAQQ